VSGEYIKEKGACDIKVAIIETDELRHKKECHDLQIASGCCLQSNLEFSFLVTRRQFAEHLTSAKERISANKTLTMKKKILKKYWPQLWSGLNHCKCRMLPENETTHQS